MNHISHALFLVLKTCQNPNPGDAQRRDISLSARRPSHQCKKLDSVFSI